MHVPPLLQEITSNRETVEVTGSTVRECVDDLTRQFPGIRYWLDQNNPIAWITVNRKIMNITDTDQKISAFDELRIVLLITGG